MQFFTDFRHSRMSLAGIQTETGPPIKAFGGDELAIVIPSFLPAIFEGGTKNTKIEPERLSDCFMPS
jgi:hypothetical protein